MAKRGNLKEGVSLMQKLADKYSVALVCFGNSMLHGHDRSAFDKVFASHSIFRFLTPAVEGGAQWHVVAESPHQMLEVCNKLVSEFELVTDKNGVLLGVDVRLRKEGTHDIIGCAIDEENGKSRVTFFAKPVDISCLDVDSRPAGAGMSLDEATGKLHDALASKVAYLKQKEVTSNDAGAPTSAKPITNDPKGGSKGTPLVQQGAGTPASATSRTELFHKEVDASNWREDVIINTGDQVSPTSAPIGQVRERFYEQLMILISDTQNCSLFITLVS